MTLQVDLACGDYDIVRPLKDGAVRAEGMEINFITINRPPEVHWRMGVHHEFDAAEMSFGSFVAGKARGDFPFVGIPAFVYRKFRHSCAYVNVNAEIEKPEDLKGKRVGVPEWQMTATVWLRGFIQDDYGVRPQDIYWRTGIFPIMHVMVIREEFYRRHPWVAQSLYKALLDAKNHCIDAIFKNDAIHSVLPWAGHHGDEVRELMGQDFWPYGASANRKTIETFLRYSHEQGLTSRKLSLEELFPKETLDTFHV
jgi:ABC-type nitrate/sulfonate/bicarbonate transport system substrate-binding protein